MNNPASLFSVNTANFTAQMAYLKSQGYQSITPQQYVQWLQGNETGLPPKPVLINFDDNIASVNAAVSILQSFGFNATMYVVSGFADNPQGWNMDWPAIAALRAAGWSIQLHAGPLGHAPMTTQPCNLYYSCRLVTPSLETPAAYQARIIADLNAGEQALISRGLLSGPSLTFATPWDSWGQDGSDTAVTSWLPGYLGNRFAVVFQMEWGYTIGNSRRFRFEVHNDHTLTVFAAALTDMRFRRAG